MPIAIRSTARRARARALPGAAGAWEAGGLTYNCAQHTAAPTADGIALSAVLVDARIIVITCLAEVCIHLFRYGLPFTGAHFRQPA